MPHLHTQGFTQQAALSWEQVQAGVWGTSKRPANSLQPRFWLHFYYYTPALEAASFPAAHLLWAVVTQGEHFSVSAISEGWWTPLESVLAHTELPWHQEHVCAQSGPQVQICKGNQDPARSQAVPELWRGIPSTWLAPLQLLWLYLYKEGLAKFPWVHVYCCCAPGKANGR